MANNLGVRAYAEGRWDDAVSWYGQSQESFRRVGNEQQAAIAGANLGEVLVSQRRHDEAQEVLDEARRVLRASGLDDFAVFADVQLARLAMERGQTAEAVDAFQSIVKQAQAVGHAGIALEASIYASAAYVASGKPSAALKLLDESEGMAGDEAALLDVPMARVRASAYAVLGEAGEARTQLEIGLGGARKQGLIYEEAQLLLVEADLIRQEGSEGSDKTMEEAHGLLHRLGVVLEDF